jgi:hypothetical protein
MALQDRNYWETFLRNAGIPNNEATTYATTFVTNRITNENIGDLTKEDLTDLGITIIGDIKNIMRHSQQHRVPIPATEPEIPSASYMKTPAAKLPELSADMTHPQFRKFQMDWSVFKRITNIPTHQIHTQLYNSCDEHVLNSLVTSTTDFFALTEDQLLTILEGIVTKKSNPAVHRLQFSSILQCEGESIKDFVTHLKSSSPDCEFSCSACQADLQPQHIKDQFIRGIYNETLQTDILAKASHLPTLEDVIKHAEAYEAAQRDQTQLQNTSDVMVARTSEYKRSKKTDKLSRPTKSFPCSGCGSHAHGQRGSNDRSSKCHAWGKICSTCKIPNHFANVCRSKEGKGEHVEAFIPVSAAKLTTDPPNVSEEIMA